MTSHLSMEERERSSGAVSKLQCAEIGRALGRQRFTNGRETKRNSVDGEYLPCSKPFLTPH